MSGSFFSRLADENERLRCGIKRREDDFRAKHVHADSLQKALRHGSGKREHDVVAIHPDAHEGKKPSLRGAVAGERRAVAEVLDGLRELTMKKMNGIGA